MPDAIFDHPRVARVYDPLDPDRTDLDSYVNVVDEFNATKVLDVGCGTGTLACRLARRNIQVQGVDPAVSSIAVARSKPWADQVQWIEGTMLDVVSDTTHHSHYDLATMTANVAQVFLTDEEWQSTLEAIRSCLRPGGHLAFESRRPSDRGWERWTKELTREVVNIPGEGPVESWVQVTSIENELVSFESPTIFHADGERIDSTSTLRFRTESTLCDSLLDAGFVAAQVRDLPYAPGRGWLIVASV